MGDLKVTTYVNDGSEKAFNDFMKVLGAKVSKDLSNDFKKAKGAYFIEGHLNSGDNIDLGVVIQQGIQAKDKNGESGQAYNSDYLLCVKLDSLSVLKSCTVNIPGNIGGVYIFDNDYAKTDKKDEIQLFAGEGITVTSGKILHGESFKLGVGKPNGVPRIQAGKDFDLKGKLSYGGPKFVAGQNAVEFIENVLLDNLKQDTKKDGKPHYQQDYTSDKLGTTTVVVSKGSHYVTTWKNDGKTPEIKIFTLGEDKIYKGWGDYRLTISNLRKVFVTTDKSKAGQELKVHTVVYSTNVEGKIVTKQHKTYLPEGAKGVALPENYALRDLFKPNGDRVEGAFKKGVIDMSGNREISTLFGVSK